MISKTFFDDHEKRVKKIAVVGLGYVGIPLFVSLAEYFDILGFDINQKKINNIKNKDNIEDFIDEDNFCSG
jgi:UDP-N-acetyl-D-glucosamine/UDP-N-acetyl-D-galactosamine dehydrogenase